MQEIMACIALGLRKVRFGRGKKKDQNKGNSSGSPNDIKGRKVDCDIPKILGSGFGATKTKII